MNWIIFTTECTGKTTFCKNNLYKIEKFTLIDYDKITTLSDEIMLIDIMLELKNKDNQIYLTNLIPPDFILNYNKHFENISFGIIKINEDLLIENIKSRHHILYNSDYIMEHSKQLEIIIEKSKKLNDRMTIFNSFEDLKNLVAPPIVKITLRNRIIKL